MKAYKLENAHGHHSGFVISEKTVEQILNAVNPKGKLTEVTLTEVGSENGPVKTQVIIY